MSFLSWNELLLYCKDLRQGVRLSHSVLGLTAYTTALINLPKNVLEQECHVVSDALQQAASVALSKVRDDRFAILPCGICSLPSFSANLATLLGCL